MGLPRLAVTELTLECGQCHRMLEDGNFNYRAGKATLPHRRYRETTCRDCRFNKSLLKTYGITRDEFNLILKQQQGKCAICKKPLVPGRDRCLDHSHKSGAVRGILCWFCNYKLLGNSRDDNQLLRRAADYLENPPALQVLEEPHIVPGHGVKKKRKKRKT